MKDLENVKSRLANKGVTLSSTKDIYRINASVNFNSSNETPKENPVEPFEEGIESRNSIINNNFDNEDSKKINSGRSSLIHYDY